MSGENLAGKVLTDNRAIELRCQVTPGRDITIGRHPSSDFYICDRSIAGQEAVISRQNGWFSIKCLGRCRMIFNGHMTCTEERRKLVTNDQFQLGRERLTFEVVALPDSETGEIVLRVGGEPECRVKSPLPSFPVLGVDANEEYVIMSKIGRSVYKAVEKRTGRMVALKVMRSHDDNLRPLVELMMTVDHQHVVRYYGCFVATSETGLPVDVIVLELLDGETLKERLTRLPDGLPTDEVVPVMDGLLAGLSAANAKGVVHRDVKPENVFLCRDGSVKLIDFELSSFPGGMMPPGSRGYYGTPEYLAPEFSSSCFCGEFYGNARSDVYSAGLIFSEICDGRRAQEPEKFDRNVSLSWLDDGPSSEDPTTCVSISEYGVLWPLPKNPHADDVEVKESPKVLACKPMCALFRFSGYESILNKAVAKKPEDRFESFEAFRMALKELSVCVYGVNEHRYVLLHGRQCRGCGTGGKVIFVAKDLSSGRTLKAVGVRESSCNQWVECVESAFLGRWKSSGFLAADDGFVVEVGGARWCFAVYGQNDVKVPRVLSESERHWLRKDYNVKVDVVGVLKSYLTMARVLSVLQSHGTGHYMLTPCVLLYDERYPQGARVYCHSYGCHWLTPHPGPFSPEWLLENAYGDWNYGLSRYRLPNGNACDAFAFGVCLYQEIVGESCSDWDVANHLYFRGTWTHRLDFRELEKRGGRDLASLVWALTDTNERSRLKDFGEIECRINEILKSKQGGKSLEKPGACEWLLATGFGRFCERIVFSVLKILGRSMPIKGVARTLIYREGKFGKDLDHSKSSLNKIIMEHLAFLPVATVRGEDLSRQALSYREDRFEGEDILGNETCYSEYVEPDALS